MPRKDKKTEPEVATVEVKAPEVEVQRSAIGCLQRSHVLINLTTLVAKG